MAARSTFPVMLQFETVIPNRVVYVLSLVVGFALGIPASYVIWAYVSSNAAWRFFPLVLFPFLGLALAFVACKIASAFSGKGSANTQLAGPRRSGRISAVVTVFLIPILMLFFLPVAMSEQMPRDLWPTLVPLVLLGFVVSVPLGYLVYATTRAN